MNPNQKVSFALGVIACLATGYGFGRWHARSLSAHAATTAEASGARVPRPPGAAGHPDGPVDPNFAHTTVARPFPPGGAKAWVVGMVTRVREGYDVRSATFSLIRDWSALDRHEFPEIAKFWKEERAAHRRTDQYDALERLDYAESVLFDVWAQEHAPGLLAYWQSLAEDPDNQKATQAVFKALGQFHPVDAAASLQGLSDDERRTALSGLCQGLVTADPATVLELATSLNDPQVQFAAQNAATRLAATDPQRTIRLAAQLAEGAIGTGPLEKAAETWVQRDASAAEAWAREYKGPGNEAVLASVLARLPGTEFDRIAAELPSLLAGSPDSKPLAGLAAVASLWLSESRPIDELMTWTETLPPGFGRHRAQAGMMRRWVRDDAPAASEWIARQPAGAQRDDFVFPLIQATGNTDPARALAWAKTLSQESDRQHWYHEILKAWERRDPEAARTVQAALEKTEPPPMDQPQPPERRRERPRTSPQRATPTK